MAINLFSTPLPFSNSQVITNKISIKCSSLVLAEIAVSSPKAESIQPLSVTHDIEERAAIPSSSCLGNSSSNRSLMEEIAHNQPIRPIPSPIAFIPHTYRDENIPPCLSTTAIATPSSYKEEDPSPCLNQQSLPFIQENTKHLIMNYLKQQDCHLGQQIGKGASSQVIALNGIQQERVIKILSTSILDAYVNQYNPNVGEHLALLLVHPNILKPEQCLYLIDQQVSTIPQRLAPVLGQISRYCRGKTLAAHMQQGLTEAQIRHFSFQLAGALSYLHAQNIIHGDVHPENVLIENNNVCLTDFGLAHQMQLSVGSRFAKKRIISSAPERLLRMFHTKKADAWSFGILLYQLLHQGNFPFQRPQAILTADLVIDPNIPADLKQLLHGLLDRNPQTRLSMYEVRRRLTPREIFGPAANEKP